MPGSCTTPSVLVVSSTLPRWKGDATPRFVAELAALATPSWNVTALAPHHPGSATRERIGAVDVHRFRYFVPSSFERLCYDGGILPNARASRLARLQIPCLFGAELSAVFRLLRSRRFDLVHAHFLVPQGAVCALAHGDVPLVVSIHGSDLFALRPLEPIRRAVLARAAIVTVNSEATRRELLARFPEVEAKVRLLPMGIDPELFRSDRRHAPGPPRLRGVGSAAREGLLAFVGRLTNAKGVHVLLEAFARLVDAGRRLRLVIGGDGPDRPRVTPAGVELRGALSPAAVAALYREAAVLVVPSLAEAQGLVAVEAMASGCPVVATDVGGLADLIGADERGWSTPPNDAAALARTIARALDDPETTRARADAARAYVLARYAWSSIRPTLLSIYEEAWA